MVYENIVEAIFIERPNRFIAHCICEGEEVIAHVKNTGRCKELLIKGVKVYLQRHNDPKRKTQYSLITVEKGNRLINIDSQVPNQMAYEALINKEIILPGLEEKIIKLEREKTYGNSRFDIYFETQTKKGFVEVKGVTLEEDGVALFPDAPTQRGVKHIYELIEAKKEGYLAYILFIIQINGIDYFEPNVKTHKEFADVLTLAKNKGVGITAYDSIVTVTSIRTNKPVECKI